MSNFHRSLSNAQLSPLVLLSVFYLRNMSLPKPSVPCVILKIYILTHGAEHAGALPACTAAAEEADEEHDGGEDHEEDDGRLHRVLADVILHRR